MDINYLVIKKCQLDPKRSVEKTRHIWSFITKKLGENEWFSSNEVYIRFANVYRRGDITRALNLLEGKHGVIRREQPGVRVINRQYLHQLIDSVPLENVHNLAFIVENLFVNRNHSEHNLSALGQFCEEQLSDPNPSKRFCKQIALIMHNHNVLTLMNERK